MIKEIYRLLNYDWNTLNKKIIHFKVNLEEGMEIIKNNKEENKEKFRIIKSSVDNELYGVSNKNIIKISEIIDSDYMCNDLTRFTDENIYYEIEIENDDEDKDNLKLVDDEELLCYIDRNIEEESYFSSFTEVNIRKKRLTVEEFSMRTNNHLSNYIKYRDKVKDKYEELLKKEIKD